MTPARLAALHARAFSASRAWSADEFTGLLGLPGTMVNGDDRCFALVRVTLDEAELLTIATDPANRRQGLAKAILKQAEVSAHSAGATRIFLEVAANNAAACALYAGAGYAQVGRRPGYYTAKDTAPIDALVLRKDLDTA